MVSDAPIPMSLDKITSTPASIKVLIAIGPAQWEYDKAGLSMMFTLIICSSVVSRIVNVLALPKTFETTSSKPFFPSVAIAILRLTIFFTPLIVYLLASFAFNSSIRAFTPFISCSRSAFSASKSF